MKQASLPLALQDARNIIEGHIGLSKLLTHFYLFGGNGYSDKDSPGMTARFLEMAPRKGDALYQLFQDSGKTFEQFVADVIDYKYFWQAIGQSFVSFVGIQIQLTRMALKHGLQLTDTIFGVTDKIDDSPPAHSE